MNERAVPEAHLGLRRMNVHIHFFGIAIEEQQRERIAGRRNQVVIGGGERVHQQLVANQPAVDEQIDRIAIELLHLRARNESAKRKHAVPGIVIAARQGQQITLVIPEVDQIFKDLAAEHLVNTIANVRHGSDASAASAAPCRSSKLLSGCARL